MLKNKNQITKTFILTFLFSFSLMFFGVSSASAMDHYVRAGATGNGNGNDWTNAYTSLPNTLVRGDAYYVADGGYSSYNFNTPENGTKYIYVRKAINDSKCSEIGLTLVQCHGVAGDWDDAYGDGVALFSYISISKSYFVFDGQIGGGPGSWTSGFGFEIYPAQLKEAVYFLNAPNSVVIKHVDMHQYPEYYPREEMLVAKSIVYGNTRVENFNLSYCYLHDVFGVQILSRNWSNILVEYNYLARDKSTPEWHAEAWSDWDSDNIVARHNLWADIEGTAIIAMNGYPGTIFENWEIYGNIFFYHPGNPYGRKGVGDGVVYTREGNPCINCELHNNVIHNIPGIDAGFDFSTGTGNLVYNNIWYDNPANNIQLKNTIHDYNWCYLGSCNQFITLEEHDIVGTGDPFMDLANDDFRLKKPIPGIKFDWMNNIDLDGNIRGADGVWDMGAYEYIGVTTPDIVPPANPSGLSVR